MNRNSAIRRVRPAAASAWRRLRGDLRLAIVTLFGASAALVILPFGVWRLANGEPYIGWMDVAIVACIAATVILAWRSRHLVWAAALLAVSANAGCLATAFLQPQGLLWLYPTLVANYFLLPPSWAVAQSALTLAVVVTFQGVFESPMHLASFLASGTLVTVFSYIFASRSRAQHLDMKMLASHDALTGAGNRRAMEEELERVVAARRREPRPVGLAMLDLDHFKRVNDTSGHDAGDRVLQTFAELVRANTRGSDRFFRYGGEEFVLLLPGADAAELHRVSDKLRATVAAGLRHGGSPITVSIGAAVLGPDETSHHWLERADAAMYRAKQGGRNRVEMAAADEPANADDGAPTIQSQSGPRQRSRTAATPHAPLRPRRRVG